MDVKNRVRAELLRLASESKNSDGSATIESMPTHAEIASRVITHREAVTRELSDLEKLGLLRKEGQRKAVITLNRLMWDSRAEFNAWPVFAEHLINTQDVRNMYRKHLF